MVYAIGFAILMFFYKFSRFAYIEFADKDSVTTSLALDESLFRGRQIKVCTNVKYCGNFFLAYI